MRDKNMDEHVRKLMKHNIRADKPYTSPLYKVRHEVSNPIITLFEKIPAFRDIFKDKELNFVPPFATILFFCATVMIFACLPYSVGGCPVFNRLHCFGEIGDMIVLTIDLTVRCIAVYICLFYIWIPYNYFLATGAAPDVVKSAEEYAKNPDFLQATTHNKSFQSCVSFATAGIVMFVALVVTMRRICELIKDDPIPSQAEISHDHITKAAGSGDATTRRTPLRQCRLRNLQSHD